MELHVVHLTGLLALGIAAQWVAWRLRFPSILVLLLSGFVAGRFLDTQQLISDELLFPVVSLSVAVVLFEGGLSLKLSELRESGGIVVRMVTVAILLTWILTAAAAYWLLGYAPSLAMLLGALLVVSGPTVIIPLMRHIRPAGRIGSIIRWEGIVNDPVGAVLAVLVLEAILSGGFEHAAGDTIRGLLVTALAGSAIGLIAASLLILMLRRYWLPDYLHSSVFLATILMAHTLSNLLQPESGLVTVTVLGIVLANQKSVTVRHVIEFKENLGTLITSMLFILLASRVEPSDLLAPGWAGVAFVAVLIVLVRPLTVFLATLGSELKPKERLFLAWMAPRGIVAAAVSSLFALELTSGRGAEVLPPEVLEQASSFASITFLVIIGTVSVYGTTAGPLANLLGLAYRDPQGIFFVGAAPWVRSLAKAVQTEGFPVLLVDTNYQNIAAARMAGLPTCYASVLSEYVHEDQEFSGIGRLLALTPNDEVNSLAVIEYAELFGRAGMYQLALPETASGRRAPGTRAIRGRTLFAPHATYEKLEKRFAEGAQLKTTKLTEDFTFKDFQVRYGTNALVLFQIEDGKLSIRTAESTSLPQPGQKLISLVDKTEEEPLPSRPQPATQKS